LIGNLFRDGTLYTQGVLEVKTHDFSSYAEGKVVPHGLYDIYRNKVGCRKIQISAPKIFPTFYKKTNLKNKNI
jgi:hypothetical protein